MTALRRNLARREASAAPEPPQPKRAPGPTPAKPTGKVPKAAKAAADVAAPKPRARKRPAAGPGKPRRVRLPVG